ncbi:MAG: M56 family metallopeptidase [Phycisphaeraceae bacterium]
MQHLLPLLLDVAIKSTVILMLAGVITALMRRHSAAARHTVWAAAIVAVLLLPMLAYLLPGLAVLPAVPIAIDGIHTTDTTVKPLVDAPATISDGSVLANVPQPAADERPVPAPAGPAASATDGAQPIDDVPPTPVDPAAVSASATPTETEPASSTRHEVLAWLPWVWLGGASFALLPIVCGALGLARLKRTSHPITARSWQHLLRELQARLGLHRPVVLRRSRQPIMPMTWGGAFGLAATVLVPVDSEDWSAPRRRAVLLHELAHIKRHDCLTQLLTQVACAMYWFNPLIWYAAHRMLIEREQACDDMVLLHETDSADYAQHLLDIATGPQAGLFAAHSGIAMARRSKLDGRLVAILDKHRNRRAMSRLGVALTITLLGAVAVPVACVQVAEPEAVTTDEPTHRQTLEAFVLGQVPRQGAYATTEDGIEVGDLLARAGLDERQLDQPGYIDWYRDETITRLPLRRVALNDPPLRSVLAGDVLRVILGEAVDTTNPADEATGVQYVYIVGDIARPGAYVLPDDDELTLLQLMVSTGNLIEEEDGGMSIEVLRRQPDGRGVRLLPRTRLSELLEGGTEPPALRADDVIIVRAATQSPAGEELGDEAAQHIEMLGELVASRQRQFERVQQQMQAGRASPDDVEQAGSKLTEAQLRLAAAVAEAHRPTEHFHPDEELADDRPDATANTQPQGRIVYLTGQVGRPGAYVLPEQGMTLLQLIASADNLKPGAVPVVVEIVRQQADGSERRLPRIRAEALLEGETENPRLEPGDVVIVRPDPQALRERQIDNLRQQRRSLEHLDEDADQIQIIERQIEELQAEVK